MNYNSTDQYLSGLFLTDLDIFFTNELSLGLYMEYVSLPGIHVPDFPDWNIAAQDIRLDNRSIGITMRIHCF